jgi:hypothetical protein
MVDALGASCEDWLIPLAAALPDARHAPYSIEAF